MSEIIVVEPGEVSESLEQQKAREVGEALQRYYPDHFWVVSFQGQALIVRHMLISGLVKHQLGRDGFGFVTNASGKTPKKLAHEAMIAGGQMLEAFGMPRGAWKGEDPVLPAGWVRNRPETFN
jgi:hypothetical protein